MLKFTRALIFACLSGVFLFTGLGGCKQQAAERKFYAADITSVEFGNNLNLTDHNGKARTLADFKGKAVVIFFGYTHCPDVCPTTLSDMAQALDLLGNDASKVQVLFVTVDPARDTQSLLASYVPSFNPSFLGLYGDEAATTRVGKEFHIYYQKQQGKNSQNYSIDHTAGSFVFDQTGKLRLHINYGQGAEKIAHDLRALLIN